MLEVGWARRQRSHHQAVEPVLGRDQIMRTGTGMNPGLGKGFECPQLILPGLVSIKGYVNVRQEQQGKLFSLKQIYLAVSLFWVSGGPRQNL